MKVLVQRSKKSSVFVDNKLINSIDYGMVLLVCFTHTDTVDSINKMIHKLINLRIFDDENGIMNKSIMDVKGSILSISQFTLYADTQKGHRPSYISAMKGEKAVDLYKRFNSLLNESVPTYEGVFGADMLVNIENDGPVTIMLEV